MLSRRYHAHIICVAHNQPQVLDSLAIFFQARAFLTYDVSTELPEAFLYGRQCIDACDYTVVVIGDSYGMGMVQNTGASQMHLSYLSARAKFKPILTLIKVHDEAFEISRQLQDFTRLLEQQENHIYYYDNDTDIKQLLDTAFNNMTSSYDLVASWMKSDENIADSLVASRMFHYADSSDAPTSTSKLSFVDRTFATENPSRQNRRKQDSKINVDPNSETFHVLELSERFTVKYSAQAYEAGNLTDVTMTITLTWQELLQALIKIPAAFSNYGLQSCMNRLIATKAEHNIKQRMPNVHAVARCQILQEDLHRLQRSIIVANWIQLTKTGVNTSQQLWALTSYAKKLFQESQL